MEVNLYSQIYCIATTVSHSFRSETGFTLLALHPLSADVMAQIDRYEQARNLVYKRLSKNPKIQIGWPEGAFYAFFSVEGMTNGLAFCKQLVRDARVGLVPGTTFGAPEEGWLRLCFANQSETLNLAIDRLEACLPS